MRETSEPSVEIMEVAGKGRGVIALKDIKQGTVILKDSPLCAAIFGEETQEQLYLQIARKPFLFVWWSINRAVVSRFRSISLAKGEPTIFLVRNAFAFIFTTRSRTSETALSVVRNAETNMKLTSTTGYSLSRLSGRRNFSWIIQLEFAIQKFLGFGMS